MPQFTYELDIPAGIVSDDTTFSSKGRWADCDGMRFRGGKPETLPGYIILNGAVASNLLTLGVAAGKIIAGSDSSLRAVTNSGASTDISPGPIGIHATFWSITNWGTLAIVSPSPGGKIYETAGALAATQVTNSPAANVRVLVTPQRQLLAFGTNEVSSGTFNGRCIRGSDLEDRTSWTPSSANNSFEDVLDDPGLIVSAELIGDYIAVWTTTTLFFGQFIGDPSQTYRWERIDGTGLVSPKAVTVHQGGVYWLAPDLNIYTWRPGDLVQQLKCPILQDFVLNYFGGNDGGHPMMYAISRFNEIWLHYSDARDSNPSSTTRYIAVCLDDMAWVRGTRTISAACSNEAGSALLDVGTYGPGAFFTGTLGGGLYVEGAGSPVDASYLQTADQYINSGQPRVMVRSAQPDFEQQTGDVSLTLYMRDRPQSTTVAEGPYTLASTATKKDFRASGRLMALKFSAASGVTWRLGKPAFDCVTMGER